MQLRRSGQALVEMALILPILATIVFGGIALQQAVGQQAVVANATTSAARAAALWGGDALDPATNTYPVRLAVSNSLATIGIPAGNISYCDAPSTCGDPTVDNTANADLPAACASTCYGTQATVTVRLAKTLDMPYISTGVMVYRHTVTVVIEKY